jgi:ribosomal-protein-alanine N-acetyltransferase
VRPSNFAAKALYTKMGFTELATRKAYYPLESSTGQREDALVMTKTLKQHANLYEH